MTTDPTPESARALLYRHGLPEDVIDGVLCLHAQELAAVIRAHPGPIPWLPSLPKGDGAGFWWDTRDRDAAADLIDPTRTASAGLGVSATPSHTELAALAVNAGRALQDEKRHYEIACRENARLRLMVDEYGAGAGALTDKLKRVRDMHRETCIVAGKTVPSGAFKCGMCEVLDAPAAPLRRLADESQQQECPTPLSHNWGCGCPTDQLPLHAESGVDTPGCDCGHDGMGPKWHAKACAWTATLNVPHPDAVADEAQQQPDTEAWDVPDARPGTTDHTLTRPAADAQPEPPVHGESVAHLAGLHDGHDQWADDEQPVVTVHAAPDLSPAAEEALAALADVTKARAATVDPAVCPRCKGDNSEAFELCATCAADEPAVDARQDGAQQ